MSEADSLKIGHFVADMMGIPHDDKDMFEISSPAQYDDFDAKWAAVLKVFEL